MSMPHAYGITSLIHYLISTYYADLTSILIVYDASKSVGSDLQQHYLDSVRQAFEKQSKYGNIIGLQWLNVAYLSESGDDFGERILSAIDIVAVEGFITILGNTSQFLHARYYATRYSTLRLKDKIYLYLCDTEENPKYFLATELLQFYPHHLMVIPETIYPKSNNNNGKKLRNNDITAQQKILNQNGKQTSLAKRTTATNNNLKVTNATIAGREDDITAYSRTATPSSSLPHICGNDINNCKYRDINFELWTQQYVGAEGNLNAIHLDTYLSGNGTFVNNVQLYPNKLLNLQQRTMRVGSLTYVPYVKAGFVPTGQGDVDSIDSKGPQKTVQFSGIEAELIKTFCQIRNCHLRVEPHADDNWGVIYENASAEGVLGDIYNQRVEMAIGCIYNWYNDITETSQFIARSAVTILGPGPAQFSRWRTIVMPFSNGVWLFLVFTIILCSITFHLIKYAPHPFKNMNATHQKNNKTSKKYEKSLLDIFAVFIQQPSADTVLHRVATRIFLVFLLSATITLENTYSGQLKSILTMPLFCEPVDTMQKWSVTGWKWAAPSIVWIHTVEKSDLAKEQHLAGQFEVRNHQFMYNATFWDNYGIGLERISGGSFSFGDYITKPALENKIVPKDDLYFDWTRAVAIRGWPLMPLFDRYVSVILETGIYMHWEEEFSYKFLDNQVQTILKKLSSGSKHKSPPQMLSIEHISGPLFILFIGYSLAFLILMAELLRHRTNGNVLRGFFM